ncbi:MAG: hypothetical protein Tsb0015_16090 [Simkaniaceae bacterium]
MNNNKLLNNKIGTLESKIDQLETELSYIDQMLVQCGFEQGIQTLKSSMQEYLTLKEDPTIITKQNQKKNSSEF